MPYYAHTVHGQGDETWELLLRHLQEVAAGAYDRGARFGAGELAHAAGLLHDLGKYSGAFQARLRDPTVRVDHSTAGAAWADGHLPSKWGRLLAHAVAGHHAGLQDDLVGRLDAKADLAASAARAAQADGLVLPESLAKPAGMRVIEACSGFQRAFLREWNRVGGDQAATFR